MRDRPMSLLKLASRIFGTAPRTEQALVPIQNMPLRNQQEAQEVVTALCRQVQDLQRRLDEATGIAAVALEPINPSSRCPAVSGASTGPAGCPRSNYAPDGLYTGDPKNWVPDPCPLCR